MEIKQTKWLIMDKKRKVVAKGTPRNRRLVFVDDPKSKARFLTYTSRSKAESGFTKNGFYLWEVEEYLREEYGPFSVRNLNSVSSQFLEPVKFEITMREVDE